MGESDNKYVLHRQAVRGEGGRVWGGKGCLSSRAVWELAFGRRPKGMRRGSRREA